MTGCTVYNNQGSCMMCCGVMVANKVSLVVSGTRPVPEGEDNLDKLIALMGAGEQTRILRGVLEEETAAHFKALFKE